MRKSTMMVQALMISLVSLSGFACAANYSNPVDGVFKGIYGDAITVEVPSLVSKSPAAGQNENGDLSFQVNSNTGYRNFNQLTDLKYGDSVRVGYNEDPTAKDNQMVASMITRIEPAAVVVIPVSTTDGTVVTPVPGVTQTVTTTTTSTE
jgi:hypothetical protein